MSGGPFFEGSFFSGGFFEAIEAYLDELVVKIRSFTERRRF